MTKASPYYDVQVDSAWERKLLSGVMKGIPYHTETISYTMEHDYHPDWVHGTILIEAKGRFRTAAEAAKYLGVRASLDSTPFTELVFLFMKPNTPMPYAKRRKDGTKMTHVEWADKNGFRHFTETTIKEIL